MGDDQVHEAVVDDLRVCLRRIEELTRELNIARQALARADYVVKDIDEAHREYADRLTRERDEAIGHLRAVVDVSFHMECHHIEECNCFETVCAARRWLEERDAKDCEEERQEAKAKEILENIHSNTHDAEKFTLDQARFKLRMIHRLTMPDKESV